jgi:hypothetical protein
MQQPGQMELHVVWAGLGALGWPHFATGKTPQATNGTRAAHMANNPSAIPVTVKYARIVSTPSRSGQD